MHQATLQQMIDEMIEHPNDLFIVSSSRRNALLSTRDGSVLFVEGDFSGTPKENEAEARRILSQHHWPRRRVINR